MTSTLDVNASSFEKVFADPGVSEPNGTTFTLPAHSSGAWRLR